MNQQSTRDKGQELQSSECQPEEDIHTVLQLRQMTVCVCVCVCASVYLCACVCVRHVGCSTHNNPGKVTDAKHSLDLSFYISYPVSELSKVYNDIVFIQSMYYKQTAGRSGILKVAL